MSKKIAEALREIAQLYPEDLPVRVDRYGYIFDSKIHFDGLTLDGYWRLKPKTKARGDRLKPEFIAQFGELKVRCLPCKSRVLAMAERFEKSAPDVGCFKLPARLSVKRESAKVVLNRYKDDQDLDQFKLLF